MQERQLKHLPVNASINWAIETEDREQDEQCTLQKHRTHPDKGHLVKERGRWSGAGSAVFSIGA